MQICSFSTKFHTPSQAGVMIMAPVFMFDALPATPEVALKLLKSISDLFFATAFNEAAFILIPFILQKNLMHPDGFLRITANLRGGQ